MAQEKEQNAPVIIKRVKKGGHEAHHGGAWKVAYADFVTAMMAFFLLLWLLQATTEEQKLGIADYFAPASVARSKSGADGILGGRTFTKKGVKPNDRTPIGVVVELPTNPPDWDNQGEGKDQNEFGEAKSGDESESSEPSQGQAQSSEQPDQNQLEEFLAAREEEQFAEAEAALRQAIDSVPELKESWSTI